MTDVIDRACEREEEMRQDALAELARRNRQTACESARFCAGCEVEIPEGRRQAVPGTQLCVDCQGLKEERER